MKRAFTLAEILITLSIISIIASITLPTVVHNSIKKRHEVAREKAKSSILNGYKKMLSYYGLTSISDLPIWNCKTKECFADEHKKVFAIVSDSTDDYVVHKFNTKKMYGAAYALTFKQEYKYKNNYKTVNWDELPYTFITNDGMIFGLTNIDYEDNYSFDIMVDTNCSNNPNKVGVDYTEFTINAYDGTIEEKYIDEDDWNNENNNQDINEDNENNNNNNINDNIEDENNNYNEDDNKNDDNFDNTDNNNGWDNNYNNEDDKDDDNEEDNNINNDENENYPWNDENIDNNDNENNNESEEDDNSDNNKNDGNCNGKGNENCNGNTNGNCHGTGNPNCTDKNNGNGDDKEDNPNKGPGNNNGNHNGHDKEDNPNKGSGNNNGNHYGHDKEDNPNKGPGNNSGNN